MRCRGLVSVWCFSYLCQNIFLIIFGRKSCNVLGILVLTDLSSKIFTSSVAYILNLESCFFIYETISSAGFQSCTIRYNNNCCQNLFAACSESEGDAVFWTTGSSKYRGNNGRYAWLTHHQFIRWNTSFFFLWWWNGSSVYWSLVNWNLELQFLFLPSS